MEVRLFEEFHSVGTYVETAKTEIDIREDGLLSIPPKVVPTRFFLALSVRENLPIFFTQKNVGKEGGEYRVSASSRLIGVRIFKMTTPIQVMRVGNQVWTVWHSANPNRVDCWFMGRDGRLELFQVGIVTHDDGQTFRLIGEYRWQGRIFKTANGELVAKPDEPVWGSILWREGESRQAIRQHPAFQRLFSQSKIETWTGMPAEIDLPLDPVPAGKLARVDWYVSFAGQKGQGIARDQNGTAYWIHGQDLAVPPNADGIQRLRRNDLISYVMIHENWGTKKDSPPKLLGVRKVVEDKAPINP